MKKLFAALLAGVLAICGCMSLIGCGKENLKFGKELLKCNSQLDTLVKLTSGSADLSIIDSIMAGYYAESEEYSEKIAVLPYTFAEEQYGIAGRKNDKAFLSEINKALAELYNNGQMEEIADGFGLMSEIVPIEGNPYAGATDNSWENIKAHKKMIVGYTVFAPIAYNRNGALTGYDVELARAVAEYLAEVYQLGEFEVEFKLIDWDSKETLLNNGTIDLIWNGLTITSERQNNMCISVPYLSNRQVAVCRIADVEKYNIYQDEVDIVAFITGINTAVIAVESGSAGEDVVVIKK